MSDLSQVTVVLPSLDPDEKLLAVVDGLLAYGFTDILLVDDGSHEPHQHFFTEAAAHREVTLLHHEVNKGKGAAMKTAFRYILDTRPDCAGVVTVDGDNQHLPQDTLACVQKMLETGHIVLGCRDFNQPGVPERSRKGNKITCSVFRIFVGMQLSDTQTGLRAIPGSLLETMLEIQGDRYEYETNMLLEMKNRSLAFEEVTIQTVYIEENKSSHFNPIKDSWRIYKLILGHFIRYTISSFASSILEEILFTAATAAVAGHLTGFASTAVPSVIARVCSSIVNFTLNRKLVFRSSMPIGQALLRYCMVAAPQMVAQMVLVYLIYWIFGISEAQTALRSVLYALVMIVLFIFSFLIQQRWVFSGKPGKEKR